MQTLLYDIYIDWQVSELSFGNARLHLTIELSSGGWKSFSFGDHLSLLPTASLGETADIKVDGAWLLEHQPANFHRHTPFR